ncbi:MAG: class I SAM-dependent methyltransferase [Acidimicrobiales bacterium]
MLSETAKAWNLYSPSYQAKFALPTDVVSYGPNVATESDLRLLGSLASKRVVELGCGGGQNAIALAKQGAHVIGMDISSRQLDYARNLLKTEQVRVELHRSDAADLAFVSANSVDLVLSTYVFNEIEDVGRVLRQAHRILVRNGLLVISLPHPAVGIAEGRSYFENGPATEIRDGISFTCYPRTIGELFTIMNRAHFQVDMIVEPLPQLPSEPASTPAPKSRTKTKPAEPIKPVAPPTLILRARKLGI